MWLGSVIPHGCLPCVRAFYGRLPRGPFRLGTDVLFLCRGYNDAVSSPRPARPPKVPKRRLDEVCFEQYPELDRGAIRSWIAQGKVMVNNRVLNKVGSPVQQDATISILAKQDKFVCRAGRKLEAALDHFGIDVKGLSVLDSGISTGGFTDCLLQRGAAFVVGVDVGYGQVAERVRTDSRVCVMERTNLRHLRLSDLPGGTPVDLVTLDLSFISLLTVVGHLPPLMTPHARLVVLIKPQFEAAKHQVQTGGVVRDPAVHEAVLARIRGGIEAAGFCFKAVMQSPVPGAVGGNKEFLAYFARAEPSNETHR